MSALVAACLLAPTAAGSQPASPLAQEAEEAVKLLIVRVEATVLGATRSGAGIIVARGPDDVHIVTANHVVRAGPQEAQKVDVQFRSFPGVPFPARLLPHRDDTLDLAVLVVAGLKGLGRDIGVLPFDLLGDPPSLQRGDALFLLGHPGGRPWRVNTNAERFIEHLEHFLSFESNLLAGGHSGGALLDGDRRIVGMLKSDVPPYGEAASVTTIVKTLRSWGYPVHLRPPALRVTAGNGRTCMLGRNHVVRCWGRARRDVDDSFPTIPGVRLKMISVGGFHVCGVAIDGAGYCIGGNAHGELGDATTSDFRRDTPAAVRGGLAFSSIAAGAGHTCGLTTDGSAYCWGLGDGGQLGSGASANSATPVPVAGGHKFKSVAASWYRSCGLLASGAAYCWGGTEVRDNPTVPTPVPGGVRFGALSVGRLHRCGVATDGRAFCWGLNGEGQLGIGSNLDREEPTLVSGRLRFRSVSAGLGGHTCGVTSEGTAYCWGLNNFGQLGNGSKTDSSVPVPIPDLTFDTISAGQLHTCGVTTDGAVYCWGLNATGGVGPGHAAEYTTPHRVPDPS